MNSLAMIEFDDVTVTYPGSHSPAVENFTHRVPAHKTTVLVGPSGCGKTTLLRLVNRMVEPSRGVMNVAGSDIRDRPAVQLRRSIGYVMQNSGLLPHYTAVDNVAVVARIAGATAKQATQAAEKWLRTAHVDESLFHRYPAELSGGQAQRVGVARGFVADPDIVLMDEPFGAVDPVVRRELQQEILGIQQQVAKTIVMVTHDIDEAFTLGDQIILLGDRGTILQSGTAEDFITSPANGQVEQFIGIEGRQLHIEHRDGRDVVVDSTGRITGIVAGGSA